METRVMEEIYQDIANTLDEMIPEDWKRILLYALVGKGNSHIFFYYYPLNNDNPIYSLCMDRPKDRSENEGNVYKIQLHELFMKLWNEFEAQKQEQWTNLTLILDNEGNIDIDFDYSNKDDCDTYEDLIIWKYKYLNILPDQNKRRDVEIIEKYHSSL